MKPVLIIMAAGFGSRFGGLKQITPVDKYGNLLIDYALYDAKKAGFETVIFIITKEIFEDFKIAVGNRISKFLNVLYCFQSLDLPDGFTVPEGRIKPWGTAHAVLSAKRYIDGNFAVINSDDFYGAKSFKVIYDFLANDKYETKHAMIGYSIENTLTKHGSVSRGVCKTDEKGYLNEIIERTKIVPANGGANFYNDDGNYEFIPDGTIVSLNFWGFKKSIMDEIESNFINFLNNNLESDPKKCEYYLPSVPNLLINENKASVKVLPTTDKWYGVTYLSDLEIVQHAITELVNKHVYPDKLWEAEK